MKTIVTTSISVFMLAVVLGVPGIADQPGGELEVVEAPAAPERWNVWGQADVEGLTVRVQPVACAVGADSGQLCVEVTAHNPTAQAKTVMTQVNLAAINDMPMMRVPSTPEVVQTQAVILQAAAQSSVTVNVALSLPEVLPFTLQLTVGAPVDMWNAGTVVASVSTNDMAMLF